MFLSTLTVMCLVSGVAVGKLHIGSCDSNWYYLEKNHCEFAFVTALSESSQPLSNCQGLSEQAHGCFKEKILDTCFTDEQEQEKKTAEFLDKEFGDDNHFCKDGLLYSMADIMKDINLQACQDQNFTDYNKCEDPFKEVFGKEFSGPGPNATRLQIAFAAAKICQNRIARSCNIPDNLDTYHFYDVTEFNPYDPEVRESLDDAVDKMENGESGSQTATIVTLVLVILVVLAAAAGAYFYLHRRDIARAEIRKEKRESQKKQQTPQEETEMQALTGETNNQDEISPA